MLTRKNFLLLLLILLSILFQACATFHQDKSPVKDQIDSLLVSNFFKSSQAGISIYDLTDNKPVYQFNEKLLLRPASNQKILTTSAAYLFLGKDYKFNTSVFHTGEIADSICKGDIYVVGGFDPDFSSHDLDSLVRQIKQAGIKEITGNLYADVSAMDSLFLGEGWMWDDDPATYAAYLTPITINKNSISISYSPGEVGKPANVDLIPKNNFTVIKNFSVTVDSGASSFSVTRDWLNRKNEIIVQGKILKSAKRDTVSLNIFNPTFYFLNLMNESFTRNGISFKGKIDTLTMRENAKKIFSIERDIEPVIINTNKVSDNLSAELLLRATAQHLASKNASSKKGIVLVDSLITLAGLNSKKYKITDGSGLSYYNLLSAELITGILKYFYNNKPEIYKKLFNSFPVAGYDGTLSNRMKNGHAYKRVHAKTGTISGASSLSGYIQTKNNHMLAFSILVQNYVGSSKQARFLQDKICEILAEQL